MANKTLLYEIEKLAVAMHWSLKAEWRCVPQYRLSSWLFWPNLYCANVCMRRNSHFRASGQISDIVIRFSDLDFL